ncbi:MAG: SDR family NAD(P)-dependent oxidoreductase [Verrucomicrobiales bacterium]
MKSIFITGANGGLGSAMARAFLEASPENRVWLGVRRGRDVAGAIAAEFPGRARCIDLDVADRPAWDAAVGAVLAEGGRLDVLVNNAGAHEDALLAFMSDESWRGVLGANLDGVFYGCRAVIKPMMAQRFGRIINVASLSALLPPAGQANYAAAKAGVAAMTRVLAKEVARSGITANTLCPGYIETEALAGMDAEAKKGALRQVPMRRFGRPAEVAAAAVFLASEAASYITGAELKIDGGIF